MSSATTSAPPMTRIHSRTARPTRLGGVAGRSATVSVVGRRARRGPRGRPCPPCRVRRDPAPGRSREHRTPQPVRSDCDHRGRRGGGEEQRVVVRATAHGPHLDPGPGQDVAHGGHLDGLDVVRRRHGEHRRARRRGRRSRPGAARRKAAVVWWLRPWWRGRGSASDARAATIGRPPRAAAASTIGATSSAVVPRVDAGADHAGSHADDDHVGAGHAHRRRSSAEGTLTASRSPPKAWPAVTVTSSSARSPQRRPPGRRGPAAGRPPSVIT